MDVFGSGIHWTFSANDVLSNSMALFSTVSGFVLLGIAIAFAPRLIDLIRFAILDKKDPLTEGKNGWHYAETHRGVDWYQHEDGSWEKGSFLEKYNWDTED